ncbi:MAG: exodeoxyribonuclease VII large subunit [Clostridiales bacterium]|nr:exodeoxyribonuclease VII large subunit [Clostridiales bacterium]
MSIPVCSVSELNAHVKALLDADGTLADVCVRGELSNYKIYPSGHHYFTLKDEGGSLRCVMFKSDAARLRFRPENGQSVFAGGRVTVYPRDGAYQLYCRGLELAGVGELWVAFEQLKARLEQEGLFDRAHKRPLPACPARIAVITSGAGAAVRDIIRVLGHRWPMTKVMVLPVRVQGAEAPPEIVGALRFVNKTRLADLIITGRGGGSIEDLWAFNDERVARAIYASEIPVISAVGHEPDFTIADFVADLRAATPSNAAELAVPDQAEVRETLRAAAQRQASALSRQLAQDRRRLNDLAARRVLQSPAAMVGMRRMELDRLQERFAAAAERLTAEKRRSFVRLAASLDALSPLKVLSRGYAITTNAAGQVLRDAAAVADGDRVRVKLERGALDCVVERRLEGNT